MRIYAAILAALVVVCSVAGLWHAATEVRIAFVLLVPVAIPITLLIVTRQEKTFLGESLIAVVLAFAAVPIALACGVSATAALTAAGVWTAAFLMSTATVHAILVRTKRRAAGPAVIVASAALVLVGGAVIAIATGGPRWTLALAPVPIVCAGVLAAGLPAKRLRTLGWLLVLANLATTVLLLVALTSRSSS